MTKNLDFVLLLDCYGQLLTDRQRSITELYYCEDLSLSEIAQPLGITRQSVRNFIKRSEQLLLDYEKQLGFAQRLRKMQSCFEELKNIAGSVPDDDTRLALEKKIIEGMDLI